MEKEIQFVTLQKDILEYFNESKVKKFDDSIVKDKNGYNWVLTFHELRMTAAMVIRFKIIFKLDHNKELLRTDEFLYLKELPNTYKIVKFSDPIKSIDKIITQNMFGSNMIWLSEFMVEPERNINNFLYDNDIREYSIFDFHIIPSPKEFYFKMNINNNIDVDVRLDLSTNKISFKHTKTVSYDYDTVPKAVLQFLSTIDTV